MKPPADTLSTLAAGTIASREFPVSTRRLSERNLLFAGGVIGGIRNGERGGLGGERGGGRLKSAGRTMKRASREPTKGPFRRLNGEEGGIHGEIPMALSLPFRTALPRHFWQRDVASFRRIASSRRPLASGKLPGKLLYLVNCFSGRFGTRTSRGLKGICYSRVASWAGRGQRGAVSRAA